jgi:feruloyl esterase
MLEMPLAWEYVDWALRYLVAADSRATIESYWAEIPGLVSDEALFRLDRSSAAGDVNDPGQLGTFSSRGGKIILYHGYGDPDISPFRTILFYQDFASERGGYAAAQAQARLFMVPGMLHCGGGSGPNQFDTLSAIEKWVEEGTAPNGLVASHIGRSSNRVERAMPLCMFPHSAHYRGVGDMNDAANWACSTTADLVRISLNGHEAGLDEKEYSTAHHSR